MMTEFPLLVHGQSLAQFLLRDMLKQFFYYSGEGDKVICPWCNLHLTELEFIMSSIEKKLVGNYELY